MKEATHLINVQTRRWTADEYEPQRRMHSGQVSRGKLLGRFRDCDRLAAREGAPTIVEAYEPIKGDPYYDRVYRASLGSGGVIEVWCRAQPITEVSGLRVDSLPWAADLFDAKTPDQTPLSTPKPVSKDAQPRTQLQLL